MKPIIKSGYVPSILQRYPRPAPDSAAAAASAWANWPGKAELLATLLQEQFGLCCYSEICPEDFGLGAHIEHVLNKAHFPALTFDYRNLAASALNSADLSQFRAQAFGGQAVGKQRGIAPEYFVSCFEPDCQRYFAYLSDGRVVPAIGLSLGEQAKAATTLAALNLNSPYLINLRQQCWEELEDLWQEHLDRDWDVEQLMTIDLLPYRQRLKSFFSLIRAFYGRRGEALLRRAAPALAQTGPLA